MTAARAGVCAALAVLLLATVPAHAVCTTQAELAGDWTLLGSNNGAWTRCELSIDAEGAFEGRCRGTGRRPPRTGTPVDGLLELLPNCDLVGQFGSGNTSQAIEGVLTEGGTVGSGVTKFGTRRQNFGLLFTLIKRPD